MAIKASAPPLRLLQRSLPRLCTPLAGFPAEDEVLHKTRSLLWNSPGTHIVTAARNLCCNRWPLAAQFFSLNFDPGANGFGVYVEESSWRQSTSRRRRSFHASGSQMVAKDLYETLGLHKGANPKEIKTAYYQLAKKYHPDVNKGNPEAEKKFQDVQQAYEILKDDKKRTMYDQVGHEAYEQATAGGAYEGSPHAGSPFTGGGVRGGGGFGGFSETIFGDAFGGGMDEIFKSMFGDQVAVHQNVPVVTVELTLREAVEGCTKQVSFSMPMPCPACNGSGFPPGARPQTCTTCGGIGRVMMQKAFLKQESICPTCRGQGKIVQEHCHQCQGSGTVGARREIRVNIPPGGIINGDPVVFFKAGVETGVNFRVRGGDSQENLTIRVKVLDDPVFRREGADVHVNVPISISQAVLGGRVQVPTLTGDVVLKIRPGTQPGQTQVLRGKGIKMLDSNRYGDQYVHINVIIPVNITQWQKMLMEDFAKEENRDVNNAAAAGSGQ